MRLFMPALIFIACAVLLSACQQPNFVPSLYHYHKDTHRSPPGPKAQDIGYEYSKDNNAQALVMWQDITDDLVDALQADYGVVPQMLYLVPHSHKNSFANSYDHALRASLTAQGYTLASDAEGVPDLYYEALAVRDYTTHESQAVYNNDDDAASYVDERANDRPIDFRITMALDSKEVATVVLQRTMPSYGYEYGGARYSSFRESRSFHDIADKTEHE